MPRMHIALVSNPQESAGLADRLTFLEETVVELAEADAAFVFAQCDAGVKPNLPVDLPIVVVGTSGSASPYPNRVVATLEEPLTARSVTTALAALYRHRRECDETQTKPVAALQNLVGHSREMCQVRSQILKVADSDASVLITGESGTGKELVARAVHRLSSRSNGPFVPVNCGAIPAELLESELFGHEKGAFTGAVTKKQGRFPLAHGGTLFLDEIGDMPFPMQVKLLRAIQEKCVEPVGSTQSHMTDVRIVSATHHSLETMIDRGEFREDLYYRLNVFPIAIEPLRSRSSDVVDLIEYMIAEIEQEQHQTVRLTHDALSVLKGYPWPGNARELRNLLQRLCIAFPNELIGQDDLPSKYKMSGATTQLPDTQELTEQNNHQLPINGIDLKAHLAELECQLIAQALDDTNSVVARAADRLHIRRTTLVEKMRKYGIAKA